MGLKAIGDRVRQLFSRSKVASPPIEIHSDHDLRAHAQVVVGGRTYQLTKLVRAGKNDFVYEGSLLRKR
jgi:hypothetical protein